MSEAAAEFFGKESVMLEPIPGQAHWQTGLVEEAIRGLKTTMTATALEHPDMGGTRMSRKSGGSIQRQRRRPWILTTTTCLGKSTRS